MLQQALLYGGVITSATPVPFAANRWSFESFCHLRVMYAQLMEKAVFSKNPPTLKAAKRGGGPQKCRKHKLDSLFSLQ